MRSKSKEYISNPDIPRLTNSGRPPQEVWAYDVRELSSKTASLIALLPAIVILKGKLPHVMHHTTAALITGANPRRTGKKP